MLPTLVRNKIDEFNKLQNKDVSLAIKSFVLRDIIEAFIIVHNHKFYVRNLSKEIKSSKIMGKESYDVLVKILNNIIHVNPFPIANKKLFNSLCGLINCLLTHNLVILALSIPTSYNADEQLIKKIINFSQFINKLIKLNQDTIKEIKNLKIDKITNKYNFHSGIIDIINRIYSKHLYQKYNRKSDDEHHLKEHLMSAHFKIPKYEIEEQYLKDACDFIEKYTKQKDKIIASYITILSP